MKCAVKCKTKDTVVRKTGKKRITEFKITSMKTIQIEKLCGKNDNNGW